MATSEVVHESARPSALVVEDEAVIGRYLADTLDDMGFQSSAVTTCEEALQVTATHGRFTVAFIDLALPDRSGLELIAELKARDPNLPIVIASGYGAMAVNDIDDNNQPPPVLCKPYDAKVVAAVLKDLGIHIPNAPHDDLLSR
jgi:ActR/RegA family two-component response regulator